MKQRAASEMKSQMSVLIGCAAAAGLLATSMLASAAGTQTRKSDREVEGLAGPVKEIQEETAKFESKSGKWIEGTRSVSRRVAYDENGRMTQEYIAGLAPYHAYAYDSRGDRLERQTLSLKTTRPPTPADFGFQSDVWVNASFFRWVFKFDEKGNRIEEARYKRSDKRGRGTTIDLIDKTVHMYDSMDRVGETALYASSGSLVRRWLYQRDESGFVTEETELNPDGSVSDKRFYSYEVDSRRNWIKRTTSRWVKRGKQSSLESVETTYRAITYY